MKKVLLFFTICMAMIFLTGCDKKEEPENISVEEEPIIEQKKLQILNEDSNSRVIAVQINNHNQARPNHAGLQDAFLVYEMIVEGGITRMMALFKDQTTAKIGSVRSARPYYLDYVLENDAIYVHFGWSPKAESDTKALGINNMNGLYDNGFWRDNNLKVDYEHRAFTNMENIQAVISQKGYRNTSDAKPLLNYSVDEINIQDTTTNVLDDGTEQVVPTNVANTVTIPYSYYMTVRYDYDSETKVYKRFANDVAHTDAITGNQYTFKNIIITKIRNYTSPTEGKGRQVLENIGSGEGYYVTNGNIRKITWSKESRGAKTIYRYENGEEITVNDGNTFIQIVPLESNILFS